MVLQKRVMEIKLGEILDRKSPFLIADRSIQQRLEKTNRELGQKDGTEAQQESHRTPRSRRIGFTELQVGQPAGVYQGEGRIGAE